MSRVEICCMLRDKHKSLWETMGSKEERLAATAGADARTYKTLWDQVSKALRALFPHMKEDRVQPSRQSKIYVVKGIRNKQ